MEKQFSKINLDIENMWKQYKEFAITPALVIYLDSHYPKFYCISFQWFAYKIAVSYSDA